MSFRRDDAALALQPFGSLLSLIIDKDLAADEREVRHPRQLVGHGDFSRGTTPVMPCSGGWRQRSPASAQTPDRNDPQAVKATD